MISQRFQGMLALRPRRDEEGLDLCRRDFIQGGVAPSRLFVLVDQQGAHALDEITGRERVISQHQLHAKRVGQIEPTSLRQLPVGHAQAQRRALLQQRERVDGPGGLRVAGERRHNPRHVDCAEMPVEGGPHVRQRRGVGPRAPQREDNGSKPFQQIGRRRYRRMAVCPACAVGPRVDPRAGRSSVVRLVRPTCTACTSSCPACVELRIAGRCIFRPIEMPECRP
ncbi:hypothetical protein DRB87_06905 [Pandoraea sp. XY-2]|nr:hypothetical protein DRB87_06905 [Pandoraea sp. XY-2]